MLNKKNYSQFIIPLFFILDIAVLIFLVTIVLPKDYHIPYFYFFIIISWLILSLNLNYYKIYRFIKPFTIVTKNTKQFLLFLLLCYSFSGFYFNNVKSFRIANYILFSFLAVLILDLLKFYLLKIYRKQFGRNYFNIVLIGSGENIFKLNDLLSNNIEYGYKVVQFFSKHKEYSTEEEIENIFDFCVNNSVKEIYLSLHNISKKQIQKIETFAENFLIEVKLVPESQDLFTYNYKIEYYNFIPIFDKLKSSLHDPIVATFKRAFDIVFSLFVIVFVLSWLIPIMAVLIKTESAGPLFFKQSRPGFDENEFFCLKFRSMRVNFNTEKEASRNDPRVTRIGRFIRKTSIDELPQFFNVLFGDMSIVGPRPHLWTQNRVYGKRIDRYMVRHYVKPGITGLAQVKGFRGEIETDEDMTNRINYDVYYIENWSFILDIKIIFQTVINIFKGEEKAY